MSPSTALAFGLPDVFVLLLAAAAGVALVWALRARRSSRAAFLQDVAHEQVCTHLQPAYDLLVSRGHAVVNAGQRHAELPFEIHLSPPFAPQAIYDEMKLAEPVFVSERNVLYCKEDFCELHPASR